MFPRAFNFDSTGTWLYALNQKGDNIVQFEINQESGELTPTGVVIDSPVTIMPQASLCFCVPRKRPQRDPCGITQPQLVVKRLASQERSG